MQRQNSQQGVQNIVDMMVFIITLSLQVFIIVLNSLNRINHRNKNNNE